MTEEIKYKKCSHCKEIKTTNSFGVNNLTKDHLTYWCKECQKAEKVIQQEKYRQAFLREEGNRKTKKICSSCNQEKSIDNFCKKKSSSDCFDHFCKDCKRTKGQIAAKNRREKFVKENIQRDKKICKRCGQEKEISEFGVNRTNSDHLESYCKECRIIRDNNFRKNNREKCIESGRKWRKENPEKHSDSSIKWKEEHKERVRELSRDYARNRSKVDPAYKLKQNLRSRIGGILRYQKITKSNKTIALLGCSSQELKLHLESLFTKGMTWENYGKWHVDHKKPCAAFDLTDPKQQEECFHYTNLQPLWAIDNIKKSSLYKDKRYRIKESFQP